MDPTTIISALADTEVESVAFAFTGAGGAIPIRDVKSFAFLGADPEWTVEGRREPAAYPGGYQPDIQVVLRRPASASTGPEVLRILAEGGDGPGVAEQEVAVTFDRQGRSTPCVVRLDRPLPEGPGRTSLRLEWKVGKEGAWQPIGLTEHQIWLTWLPPRPPSDWAVWESGTGHGDGPDPGGPPWVYREVLEWTCQWSMGCDDPRAICDAILASLPATGLRYAMPAWSVGDILRLGGGYCGGMYRLLQALAGAQGVAMERREIDLAWDMDGEEARWCALVVANPGLNRTEPTDRSSLFRDLDSLAPDASLHIHEARRYRFWGLPGIATGGHCVNFLYADGLWYLYDACFLQESIPLPGFSLPPSDPNRQIPIGAVRPLKEAYLDHCVPFLLGSLTHDGVLYRSSHPGPSDPHAKTINGLSVRTTVLDSENGIALYWH